MQGITSKCKQTESRGQVQGKMLNGSRGASYNEKECESQWRYHISNRHKTVSMNNWHQSNTESEDSYNKKEIKGERVKWTPVAGNFNSSHTDTWQKIKTKEDNNVIIKKDLIYIKLCFKKPGCCFANGHLNIHKAWPHVRPHFWKNQYSPKVNIKQTTFSNHNVNRSRNYNQTTKQKGVTTYKI